MELSAPLQFSFLKDHFPTLILCLVLLVAAISDLKSQRIPNYLTLPSALLAIAMHTTQTGWNGFLFSVLGMLAGTGLLLIPYIMGGMGAGDAKLLGAVGAFLGAKEVFIAFLMIALLGGVYAILMVLVKRTVFKGFFRHQYETFLAFLLTKKYTVTTHQKKDRPRLCYGVAIALGTYIFIGLKLKGVYFF